MKSSTKTQALTGKNGWCCDMRASDAAKFAKKYADSKLGNFSRIEVLEEDPVNPEEEVLYAIVKPGIVIDDYWFRFDAMELDLSDNDSVSIWPDMSDNGFDVTQSDSAKQPTYLATGYNGRPTVQFSSDELENVNFSLDRGTGGTIFLVGKLDNTSSSQSFMCFGFVSAGPQESRAINIKYSGSEQGIKTQLNSLEASGTSTIDSSEFIHSTNYNGSISKTYKNGVYVTEVEYDLDIGYAVPPENLILGRSLQTNRLEPVNGRISELIYFSRSLTDAEMDAMHTHLLEKWGF